MTYLEIIKPKNYIVKIDKKVYPLRFTLESFAYLEERFTSVAEAINHFNKKDFGAIIVCFEAGLLHTKKDYDIHNLISKADPEMLIFTLAKAMTSSITGDYGFEDEWDWSLLYFIGKTILHLTEDEFWHSTPRKILSMLTLIKEIKGIKTEELIENDAAKAFMSW